MPSNCIPAFANPEAAGKEAVSATDRPALPVASFCSMETLKRPKELILFLGCGHAGVVCGFRVDRSECRGEDCMPIESSYYSRLITKIRRMISRSLQASESQSGRFSSLGNRREVSHRTSSSFFHAPSRRNKRTRNG